MLERYVAAKAATFQKEKAFKHYITDGVRIITEILATKHGGEYISVTYDEVINPEKYVHKTDAKTDAISTLNRIGIEVITNEYV